MKKNDHFSKKETYMKRSAILYIILGILIVLQFFQIDRNDPETDPSKDFLAIAQPPAEIEQMIRVSCYDCHSFETAYPWYTYINPVGWWVKNHIHEGREHLNFSEWANYSGEKRAHKLEECYEEVGEGEMPLSSYTLAHGSARLSQDQRDKLVSWFKMSSPVKVTPGIQPTMERKYKEDEPEYRDDD
jgi:hypothetical protein